MNQEHLQQPSTYSQRFSELNQLLEQSAALWQVRAFEANALPWAEDFPQLAEAVWALADAELDGLDAEQSLLVKALSPALSLDLKALGQDWDLSLLTASIAERTVFNDKTVTDKAGVAEPLLADNTAAQQGGLSFDDEAHFSAHIKGRKWQQITAFVQHLPQLNLPVLEWCAGKGHLGRLIAKARGADVLSLEWQAPLCEAGQAFADKWQLSQTFICADAFAIGAEHAATNTSITTVEHPSAANPLTTNPLTAQQQAVALHACGDLHVRLLTLAVEAGTQALAISPCCYHLIQASHYQPLSNLAQQSSLKLSRHDLQLPLQQSVIANPKQQALRHQEIAWRLGFDALQRQCRQIDAYLPLPSLKQSQLSGSFTDFCLWAAQTKAVNLAKNRDFEAWLEIGRQRQQLTRRIDLVAHLFRTVLEQWLILDRACFLQEQGYGVCVGEFCANSVTPRNTLILAQKMAV
ncbi:MAG: SAM-dependent methyltransferase [Gammaproteobacteria bacterium]|nr:SAM-dependent methyltransferase [Gammaproteobacteria bacterium]MBU1478165.1 SAM-dependent methyltransferase [Gammaproteobacteria bacterium]MBU2002914.1 SAM-dependent methyltransferase [Gammaproteobacteria bacterium]MBU2131637.1 SAM-dependent methyltransferase [Gammaproteobacteria bacterium]MBU2185840.1 SAM-dependent methyltransferase [Gammaproteobacteria bacterium]